MRGVTALIVWIWLTIATAVAIEDNDNSKTDKDFIEWFESNGGSLGGIELSQFENMGRGVKASSDLKTDDVIISVPLSICMSRMTASNSPSNTLNNMFKSLQNDEDVIALLLLRERAIGDKSMWAPYIKTLPQSIPQGAYFGKEPLKALNDPVLAHKLKDRGNSIESRHKKLGTQLHVLKNYVKSVNKDENVLEEVISLSAYQWALSVVSSRALTFRGERFLAPMCDMFNYSPHPSYRAQESGAFYLRHHILDKESKTLTVTADRNTRAGEQVFEDYGDNPSSLYLDHHGFVPYTNPFDCVNIQLNINDKNKYDEEDDDASYKAKQTLLERMRITKSTSPSSCIFIQHPQPLQQYSDFGISAEIWSWLLIHYEMEDDVLQKCVQLLDRYSAGEDREVLMAEVREGACDLLSSGPKPPMDWTPSKRVLRDVLLPAMLQRKASMDDAVSIEEDTQGSVDMQLALNYKKEQEALLNRIIEYSQKILTNDYDDVHDNHKAAFEVEVEVSGVTSTTQESTIWTNHEDCKDTNSNDSFLCAIAVFNQWVRSKNFPVQKIEARQVPGMRVGTLAIETIHEEDLYLAVPTNAVMDQASARASSALLQSGLFSLLRKSGEDDFYSLLFHLLYEHTVLGTKSEWWPYLRLLPSLAEIKPPAEYTDAEMALLKGSQVQSSIFNYKAEILKRWDVVRDKSFLGPAFKSLFPTLKEEQFRWAHYILDSRSIWWNIKRHLVPLLDLINCGEGDWVEKGRESPNRVHSTKPAKHGRVETADTYASQDVAIGEQLFENYGQPNNIYLQYHGFVLEENSHDCVSVTIPIVAGDEGMEDVKNLRKRMKQYGFSSGVQSFCIANPTVVKKAVDLAKKSNQAVNWQMLGDGRLLTWIALKYGRSIGSDISKPFKETVSALIDQYPTSSESSSSEGSGSEPEAGEGIGGGKGSNHPAAKLVKQEINLLKNLFDVL